MNLKNIHENGESWNVDNCTKATCSNGTAILKPKECEPVEPVVCENGHSPIKAYDESGCCFHYECEYCLGPNGTTKEPGEKWESNCQECECPMNSTTPLCKPLECSILPNKTCDKPGQVPVIETVDCCKKVTCECNVDTCPETNHTCSEGFKPIIITPKGSCCPEYDCQPKPVCVHNETEYQPGASVPTDKCEECKCSSTVDPETKLHSVECTPMKCDENCQLGSEYEAVPGECCGKCVEKSCVVTLPDNKTQIIEPGQIWTPPDEKCEKYKCEKIEDQLVPVEVKTVCAEFNPENCVPNSTYLEKDGCKSTEPVEINSCEGTCKTSSMYSLEANTMMHACSCCQEMSTSSKQVEMICPDGTKTNYTYTYVETCSCKLSECTENQASKKGARRRRR
ncbi:hypothetical protein SKAU_G00315890 [Synaphobranchus kaupii]|uniref:CTCK domain-containing protein n=1 Tax=Synaphobranchus kaupii TaxID=118154 RepID=A0A9Q1ILU0_SYNKA|nr:hypothetical protein SKAU_G00315890 [Synaphobranchus kaupii]